MDIELVTDPYACMMYIVSALAGLGGGISWRPPAYSLLSLISRLCFISSVAMRVIPVIPHHTDKVACRVWAVKPPDREP